ncbi:unnamed protein product [Cylicostephanus goldi]|uniref:Uncharacterized protein n=1 Tax=Cylicostephanus goldi TaxID=71465 RepID=A0A3P6S5R3_CYLGO|nr:unnamed protein product [Cylicostephanus goldi]
MINLLLVVCSSQMSSKRSSRISQTRISSSISTSSSINYQKKNVRNSLTCSQALALSRYAPSHLALLPEAHRHWMRVS